MAWSWLLLGMVLLEYAARTLPTGTADAVRCRIAATRRPRAVDPETGR